MGFALVSIIAFVGYLAGIVCYWFKCITFTIVLEGDNIRYKDIKWLLICDVTMKNHKYFTFSKTP